LCALRLSGMPKTDARIATDDVSVGVEWTVENGKRSENEDVRDVLVDAAPFEADVSLWGDELYFDAPVEVTPEETTTVVEVGTVAYWHQGNALCVFWGPTPASTGEESRAAGPVAPVGRAKDTGRLSSVEAGETVRFETS